MIAVSREAARLELRKRALRELRARSVEQWKTEVREAIIRSFTRKQRAVFEAIGGGVRYLAMCCGRRAGKTNLIAKLLILVLLDAGHNEAVFYVAWSLKIGKGLIWKDMDKLCEDYCLSDPDWWRLTENTGQIDTHDGASFFILGLNKTKQSNLTRGFKAILFCIDESQDLEHLLPRTLVAVAPALSDCQGVFIAAGTGPYVRQGTWFDWSEGRGGFLAYNWNIRDNERFPQDPEKVLREERERNEWTEDHPDYVREWEGRAADDVTAMLCEYLADVHGIDELPPEYSLGWRHVIGMDYGWDDGIAWVVVAANPHGPERIVVHAERHEKIDNDAASEITARLVEKFETTYVVCDPAGGGKGFYATFNSRYGKKLGCQIAPADKLGKVESIKVINTEFRRKRLKVYVTDANDFAREVRVLRKDPKEVPWKGGVLTTKTIRDDCFDAFRYAMVEIAPWQEKPAPTDEQKAKAQVDAEWRERIKTDQEARERDERNRAASKHAGGARWWEGRR